MRTAAFVIIFTGCSAPAMAGTFTVVGIEVLSTGIGYAGSSDLTHLESVSTASGFKLDWSATATVTSFMPVPSTGVVSAQPRARWKIAWAPDYPNEPVPLFAPCTITWSGNAEASGLLRGYPGTYGQSSIAQSLVTTYVGNSPSGVALPAGFSSGYSALTGTPTPVTGTLPIYTGAFAYSTSEGRYVGYAEQTFIGSIQVDANTGGAGAGFATATGKFNMSAWISNINGVAV